MIAEALSYIDPTDRDTWVRMAFAIKSELGEEGFEIWDQWSRRADNYNEKAAESTWRSAKIGGGVKIGTLYAMAKRAGWIKREQNGTLNRAPIKREQTDTLKQQAEQLARQYRAALIAKVLITKAELGQHPYLERKGFPDNHGLVLEDKLLVPMRVDSQVTSVQTITADGTKKFLSGGRAKGASFTMGAGEEVFYCEGYATGLSIRAAFQSMHRQVKVVVCFSAGNIQAVAKRGFVVADNDESLAGSKAAEKTGLPWWMPPTIGDANDYHLSCGLRELAKRLNELRRGRLT